MNVVAEELGIGMYAEVDGRKTRVMNLDLRADVGADLNFDSTTGNLAIAIDLPPGAITPTVSYNEFAPDANAAVEEAFSGLVDTLVGSLLGDLLGGFTFRSRASRASG